MIDKYTLLSLRNNVFENGLLPVPPLCMHAYFWIQTHENLLQGINAKFAKS